MLGVRQTYWLYFVHWQLCITVTLYWLPSEFGALVLVQEHLPSLVVVVVVELRGPEIQRC